MPQLSPNPADYLTLDQAAVALHTTRWVVYRIVRTHHLPIRRVGKSITVRAADVAAYLP